MSSGPLRVLNIIEGIFSFKISSVSAYGFEYDFQFSTIPETISFLQ